jgi:hypothetical protein
MEHAVQNDGEVVLNLGRGEITVFVCPYSKQTESKKGNVLAHGPWTLAAAVQGT